jgi:hypothetical protein
LVNVPLWRFFGRKRGWAFALACVPLHALHSLSSGAGFAIAAVGHVAREAGRRADPIPASNDARSGSSGGAR